MSGHAPNTDEADDHSAPETMEGWYVQHDCYDLDWSAWRQLSAADRRSLSEALSDFVATGNALAGKEAGDSAIYQLIGQKGDLMLLHYRRTVDEIGAAERDLRALPIWDLLRPRYGYLSVVEASLYEATGRAHAILARQGLTPGSADFADAFETELATQKAALQERVYRPIPPRNHICFYPMSKRRGEQVNWYDMPMQERRALMRGHGRIGQKYFQHITQVISGSVALDDWEWAVDLHGDDPLQFKKLVYEMRFDPASSRFAEFGPFYIGSLLLDGDALHRYLDGNHD